MGSFYFISISSPIIDSIEQSWWNTSTGEKKGP